MYVWRNMQGIFTGLFIGGAVSNIIDRIYFGGVRDWFPIPFVGLRNNLADWAIFLAVFLSVVQLASRKGKT